MADSLAKYKSEPVRGIDIFKTSKFLASEEPYQTILPAGLLPGQASVSEMITKCTTATNLIIDKLTKYKELGYVRDDNQLMALGQLIESSETGENFIIANVWRKQKEAEKIGDLTKIKLIELLDNWFNYHKHRIGWSGVTTQKVLIRHPQTKKVVEYRLSDRYNKPINQCLYPYVKGTRKLARLGNISLSVGQAESIITGVADRYVNDNDAIRFSQDNLNEYYSYVIIATLSGYDTESSQTFQGTVARGLMAYKTMRDVPAARKRRKRLELEQIKTEEKALEEIAKREAERIKKEAEYREILARRRDPIDIAEVAKANPLEDKEKEKAS